MRPLRLTEGLDLVNAPVPFARQRLQQAVSEQPIEQQVVHQSSLRSAMCALLRALNLVLLSFGLLGRLCLFYLLKHPIHAALNLLLLCFLGLVIYTGSEIHQQMILSKISDQTIDRVIDSSRFTRNYDSEELTRSGAREFLRAGAPRWAQREGVRAILFNARRAGLSIEDQSVLLAIADIESGFNPMARAGTTTACGLFQFVRRTGEIFNLSTSDCMDPWLNARSGVEHYLYNYRHKIESQVQGLDPTERLFRTFELSYYLHHDGPESADPSNEVKATILSGTQFLFKAYRALRDEELRQAKAPTFAERFYETFSRFLDHAWREISNLFDRSSAL